MTTPEIGSIGCSGAAGSTSRTNVRRRRIFRFAGPLALALGLAVAPGTALAHGFGQRYTLPVPLWLYLYGAAGVVLLSFIMIAMFVGEDEGPFRYPRFDLLSLRAFRVTLASTFFLTIVRLVSVALAILTLATALFGTDLQVFNWSPTFVWIIWWVGLSFFTLFIANIWPLISPWKIVFDWADDVVSALRGDGQGLSLGLHYPDSWGIFPGLIGFYVFIWIENVYLDRAVPLTIGVMFIIYSCVTWAGMALFGSDLWLARCDPFAVFYSFLGKFAPTEVQVTDPEVCAGCSEQCLIGGECIDCYECYRWADRESRKLNIRPWAVGLARAEPIGFDRLTFVLLMLAGVTFDGLEATPFWTNTMLDVTHAHSQAHYYLVETFGLTGIWVLFGAIFLVFSGLVRLIVATTMSPFQVATRFVYSLLPIALAYQVAHYFTLLLIQGQLMFALISDPFGRGWNLFGTANTAVNAGVVGARFVWYTEVGLIVAGHIIAVYLAHVIARRLYPRRAVRSQYPLLALMVMYTVTSLWIIAQPITEEKPKAAAPVPHVIHHKSP